MTIKLNTVSVCPDCGGLVNIDNENVQQWTRRDADNFDKKCSCCGYVVATITLNQE